MPDENEYSYLYTTPDDLVHRLEDTLNKVYDIESTMAVKDAIIYIQRHFFYNR